MKKRFVAVILAAVMALSVCACGKENVEQKSTESSQKVEESASISTEVVEEKPLYPIVDEPLTIKGIVLVGTNTEYNTRDLWDKIAEVTGIKVEWEYVSGEAWATYLAGNEWPDIIHAGSAMTRALINDYGVAGGRFVDFSKYLDIMPNLSKTYEDYPLLKKAVTETNGAIYFPGSLESSVTNVSDRPHTRMDVLKAAGVTKKPETIDEFYEALKALYAKNGSAGMIWSNSATSHWSNFLFASFGPLVNMTWDYDENNQVIFSRTTEQFKNYLKFLNKLYEEKLIHQEYLTLSSTEKKELELGGTIGFMMSASASLKQEHFLNGEWELECLEPLTSEYDNTQVLQRDPAYKLNQQIFINVESKYVEEICKMIDILFATEEVVEGSGLFGQSGIYGIEGKTWQRNDDMTYSLMVPEGYEGTASNYQYKHAVFFNLGRGDALDGYITDTPGNNQERQKAYVASVIPYATKDKFPNAAFKLTEDEQRVWDNKYASEISTYISRMYTEFVTGVADIDTQWDAYVKELEKMGIKECIAIYQAAYDRFMK